MATDTNNISSDTIFGNALEERDVEHGHLTQSNAPVPVQVPAGENVVRIQVTPGETIQLPFPTDNLIAKLSSDNANLAVKVGDITVILLGYSEANAAGDVTLIGSDGEAVDVAAVLASTDPNLDIATAAGPGAGDQGTGADNNGGNFARFDPASGLGGLNAVGGLDPTLLQYGLLNREFPEIIEADEVEVDTVPTLLNIRQGGVVNEDDLGNIGEERAAKPAPDHDPQYQEQITGELANTLGIIGAHIGQARESGNDPFDLNDHEEESANGNDPANEDNGQGVDIDREPVTSTAVIAVDFHQDVPGKISFQNGASVPLLTQLEAMGLTSHGHELQFKLLPAVADDPSTSEDESHGEVVVAYYVQQEFQWVPSSEGEGGSYEMVDTATIVFTIGLREPQGDTGVTEFHLDFTIYAPVDNIAGPVDADGDILDSLDIDVPFFMVDSDGSVTPSPSTGGVTFHSVDDVPYLGELDWRYIEGPEQGPSGDGGQWVQVITHTDTSLVHDETTGVQYGGAAEGPDGDVDPSKQAEDDSDPQWYGGSLASALAAAGLSSEISIVGMATKYLNVSFGADGRAGDWQQTGENDWQFVGNKEAGKTVFIGDGDTNAVAFQLYIGEPNTQAPLSAGATNWTVMIDGVEVVVHAVQVDANTIFGYANLGDVDGDGIPDNQGGGEAIAVDAVQNGDVPVFVLRVDPSSGELTLVQLHQINHDNPNDSDQTSPNLIIGDEPVTFRATDYDGDHVDAELQVAVQDDGPTAVVVALEEPHTLTLDETLRQGGDGIASVTVNFSDNFNSAGFNFGTDGEHVGQKGADGVSYTLSLTDENVGSGLYAVDAADVDSTDGDGVGQGAEITLSQLDAHTVVGTLDSVEYFRITTADNGDVTFTQSKNIWHDDTVDHDDQQGLNLAEGTLKLILTLTDGDGDHASGSLDIGNGVFAIEDDGPVASVNDELRVDTLILDESPASNGGDGVRSVSAAFGDNFNAGALDFGADGPGSVAYVLNLAQDGIGSGLYALDNTDATDADADGIGQGQEILLSKDGADVVGKVGDTEYFRISVDGDGKVTFTQSNNIWHGDASSQDDTQSLVTENASDLKITQILTDADGDTSSASIDLGDDVFSIQDDGPNAVVSNANADKLTLDESLPAPNGDGIASAIADFADNFNSAAGFNYGTDGQGSASYSLDLGANGTPSGLFALDPTDASFADGDGYGKGQQIVLNKVGDEILGQVGNVIYFTISVDGDGKVTFTQLQNIWHAEAGNADESGHLSTPAAGDLKITQTLTDADGDTSSASINLGQNVFSVEDDGPTLVINTGPSVGALSVVEDGENPGSQSLAISGPSITVTGTDGYTTKTDYTLALVSSDSGLQTTIGNHPVTLVQIAPGVIEGRFDNDNNPASPDAVAFRVEISGTSVKLTSFEALEHDNNQGAGENNSLNLDGKINLVATVTATDTDGDQVIGSQASVSPLSLTITDTNPVLNVIAPPSIAGISVIEDSDGAGSKSVAITPPLYSASAVDGVDHVGIAYALNLTGTTTTLVTTDGNHPITLVKVTDSLIEGRYEDGGTKVAFTVTITGAAGAEQVTLTSNVALEHANTPQGAGEDNTLDLNGLINVSAVVTLYDGDNDSVSAPVTTSAPLSLTIQDTDPTLTINTGPSVAALAVVEDSDVGASQSLSITAPTFNASAIDGVTTATSYTLALANGAASGLMTTNGNHPITLEVSGDGQTVTGKFDSDGNGSLDGIAFSVQVTGAAGAEKVTLTSFEALEHDNNQGAGESNTLDLNGKISLVATVTATDGDNDSVVASQSSATTLSLTFQDTDPALTINTGPSVRSLTTIEDSEFASRAIATIVAPTFTANAVDGFTSKVDYTLFVVGGTASGIFTTSGHEVFLESDGTTITGRFDSDGNGSLDAIALTVTIGADNNGSPALVLTSNEALEHPNNPQGQGEINAIDFGGKIGLTATVTITDGDGDVIATQAFNAAPILSEVLDTDPTLVINGEATLPPLAVVEAGPGNSATQIINPPSITASAVDGYTTSFDYKLALSNGAVSGLVTTIGNFPITLELSADGKTITGVYNNGASIETAFTLVVSGNQVTLTSNVALEHDNIQGVGAAEDNSLDLGGKVTLVTTVTVTDGDNDTVVDSKTSSSSLDLSFNDTDPTLNVTTGPTLAALEVFEASAGNSITAQIGAPAYNAMAVDGQTSSIDYKLGLVGGAATGLMTTLGNHPIALDVSADGKTISGKFDSDGNGSLESTAFTITISGDQVTLTSNVALEHANTPQGVGEDNTLDLNGLVKLIATVTTTDGDNDSVVAIKESASPLEFIFKDTDPILTLNAPAAISALTVVEDSDVAGKYTATIMAPTFTPSAIDGIASTNVAYALGMPNGAATGLVTTDGNHAITLVKVSDTVVEGRFDHDNNPNTAAQVAFKVELSGTTVTLTSYVALEHDNNQGAGESNTLSLSNLVNVTATITAVDGDGDPLGAPVTSSAGIGLNFTDTNPNAENDGTLTMTGLGTQAGAASLLINDLPAAVDNAAITSVKFGATDYALVNGSVDIPVTGGTLTVKADGTWSFNQTSFVGAPTTHNFTYTLTDGDGDTDTATFAVALKQSLAPTFEVSTAKVDEDGLVNQTSIPAGPGDDNQDVGDSGAGLADPDGAGPRNSESVWQQQLNVNWGGTASGSLSLAANQSYLQLSDGTPVRPFGSSSEFLVLISSDNGHTLTAYRSGEVSGGQPLPSALPYLTITVTDSGALTVNLLRPVQNPGVDDPATVNTTETSYEDNFNISLSLTASNTNGQSTQHSFNVNLDDDSPIAFDDTDAVTEGLGNQISGNVITGVGSDGNPAGADYAGADNSFVAAVSPRTGAEGQPGTPGNLASPLQGTYGTLTLNPDGSYVYKLTATSVPPGAKDYFNYTLVDADGDKDAATLTITINQDSNVPLVGTSVVTVDEEGLPARGGEPAGTQAATNLEIAHGTLTIATPEALASLTIGGTPINLAGAFPQTIVNNTTGTLVIDSITAVSGGYQVNYTYTLKDNDLTHSSQGKDDTVNGPSFQVVATDATGDLSTGAIKIVISDDAPTAVADMNAMSEDTAPNFVTGNVLTNDVGGADDKDVVTQVSGSASNVGATITTAYGTIVINANGSYTYTLDNTKAAVQQLDTGESLTEQVTYQMKDKDGDVSSTTLTITINGTNDTPVVGNATARVSEEGLPTGIPDATGNQDTTNVVVKTGTISVSDADVEPQAVTLSTAASLTSGGQAIVWSGQDSNTLIGKVGAAEIIRIVIDNSGNYTVTLSGPVDHANTAEEDEKSFGVSVKSSDGTTSSTGTLTVIVEDDSPAAAADAFGTVNAVTSSAVALGNVLTNDAAGADGYAATRITGVAAGTGGGTVSAVAGGFDIAIANKGTAHIDSASGAVTFTASAGNTISNTGESFSFTYTIKDKDGDSSQATVTYTMKGAIPDAFVVGQNVDDTPPQTTDHLIDTSTGKPDGSIDGDGGNDLLVGDVGGKSGQITAGNYNVCLILDYSTSMNDTFPDSGGKSRLQVLQESVAALLTSYAGHPGTVNVKIVVFGTNIIGQWTGSGDFTLQQTSNGQNAIDWINTIDDGRGTQYTNYEAAMQAARTWFDSVYTNGYNNKAYFLSDGDPTAYLNGNTVVQDSSPDAGQLAQYLNEAVAAAGTMLQPGGTYAVDMQAVGIGGGVTKANLDKFDNTGDTAVPGDAQIVENAGELAVALDVGQAATPFNLGSDILNGGDGNDVMFGDAPYTEAINDGNANTIGWQNFAGMTQDAIKAWLLANADAASGEYAGQVYGNDTMNGGAGNDTMYGQGGNDLMTGGTGNDRMVGGSGNDTYNFTTGDGIDSVEESKGAADIIVINGGATPTVAKVGNDLVITYNGGADKVTVKNHFLNYVDATTNQQVEFVKYNGAYYAITGGASPALTLLAPTLSVANVTVTEGGLASVAVMLSAIYPVDVTVKLYTTTGTAGVGDFAQTYNGSGNAITVTIPAGSSSVVVPIQTTQDSFYEPNETFTVTLTTPTNATIAAATATVTINNDDALPAFPANSLVVPSLITAPTQPTAPTSGLSAQQNVTKDTTGTSGNDWITDNNTGHTLSGGAGHDRLEGVNGNDTLNGDAGNDWLDGGVGNDTLNGGADNDVLFGGTGNDAMTGGDGNDAYVIDSAGDVVTEGNGANSGTDTIFHAGNFDYTMANNVENLVVTTSNNVDITGNGSNNQIFGGSGSNIIDGGDGSDYIDGGAGNDTLDGGLGNDVLIGAAGNDKMSGGDGDDIFKDIDTGDLTMSGASIDGGIGTDLIDLHGLAAFNSTHTAGIKNVEMLDFEGGSGTNIALSYADVIGMTDSDHVLAIRGDATDNFDTTGWTQVATGVAGDGGRSYTAYQQNGADGVATVYVENVI